MSFASARRFTALSAVIAVLVAAGALAPGTSSQAVDPPLKDAYVINPGICLVFRVQVGCINGTQNSTLAFNRPATIDAMDPNDDGNLTREEVAELDRGLNQLHQLDGGVIVVVYVEGDQNVTFTTDKGRFRVDAGNEPTSFVCDTAPVFPFSNRLTADEDCDNDGVIGDGILFAQLLSSDAPLGPGTVTVTRTSTAEVLETIPITVVGEAASVEFEMLESKAQNGAGPGGSCAIDFDDISGTAAAPQRALAIARVRDAAGTDIAGAWTGFGATDQMEKIRFGAPETTSMALGTYGVGALTTVCGVEGTGIVPLSVQTIAGPLGLSAFDPSHGNVGDTNEIRIVGPAASLVLGPDPEVLCDGVATVPVSATLRDAEGTTVADGVAVTFSVPSVGMANPVVAATIGGVATTSVSGLSAFTVGMPVIATSGALEVSTLVTCAGFDTDGDGLPNTFEEAYACMNQSADDSRDDPDLDGVDNTREFGASANPCNPNTDGDACGDALELGDAPELGGDRDPAYAWDLYDVTGDSEVDLKDAIDVLLLFAEEPGSPGYDPAFDRYAPDAAKPWRTALATDGIDLTDALVNLDSFGHGCNPD